MLPMLKQQVTGNAMQCSRESRKHHVGWLCFFAYSMTRNDKKRNTEKSTQRETAEQNIMGIIAIETGNM